MRMILAATLAIVPLLAKDGEPAKRLDEAAAVFSEVMATPDSGIPEELLANAHCIVIVPGLKTAAFVVGGKYGKGYLSCRSKSGQGWSAPATVRIEGGSVGFQIGGSTTDLIMLVMSERGADKLLSTRRPTPNWSPAKVNWRIVSTSSVTRSGPSGQKSIGARSSMKSFIV
jgi:lipid-binding SYLF domain-containing protein